jgi:glycosyltransferase involved in cell wall biosynthesis
MTVAEDSIKDMQDSTHTEPFAAVVVAPTHDNDATLADVVRRVRAQGLPLIVVNDGSTDDTAAVLSLLRDADPGVTVLTHPRNRGKAAALMTGFAAAGGAGYTHAVTIDTDGQLDPEQIPSLLSIARRSPHALVIGQRDENIDGYPSRSRIGRRVSNLFVWMQSGVRVSDSQCGFRVYPLSLLRAVRCRAGRYGFETEIITRAGWAGVPVVGATVRCHYFPREKAVSHFRPFLDSFRSVPMHFRLMVRALVPVPHRRTTKAAGKGLWRRLIDWLNPMPALRQLREDDVSRANAAAGLAMGAFIANLPAYGFQTAVSLYAAKRFHLHPVSVVLGSHLSTPPVGPVLVAAAIGLGHMLLHGEFPTLASYDVRHTGVWPLLRASFVEWMVGGFILGLFSAWVTYLSARWLFKFAARAPENPPLPASV